MTTELREIIDLMKRETGILRIMSPKDFAEKLENAIVRSEEDERVLAVAAMLPKLDSADVLPFKRREEHRCSRCGHRWENDPPVKLCGDCWRAGQSAIFASHSHQPICANCGCPALHHPTSNAGIPLGRACSCDRCPVYSPVIDDARQ
jgi:hypothetical protein